MGKLIKAEVYKLQKLPSFRMIFLFVLVVGVLRGFSSYPGYQVYIISLIPELFDAVLISVFTAAFLCTEFANRTFGNALLCGTSCWNVFLAKLAVYFSGLFILILLPTAVSTLVSTARNGFGADWDAVFFEIAIKFFFYICHRFSMAAFAIFIATVIQNPIGTLGLSAAGIYLATLIQNPLQNPHAQDIWIVSIIKITIFLSVATFIFIRRDLK